MQKQTFIGYDLLNCW